MQEITQKQKKVLDFITDRIKTHNLSPTIREIMKEFGFTSTGTARDYLKILARKGYLIITNSISRGIELSPNVTGIPVIGRIKAGSPDIPLEDIEEYIQPEKIFSNHKDIFMLKVKGDSMKDAGIIENDLVIVKKQDTANTNDIVVALLDNEITIKMLKIDKKNKIIILEPANTEYKPIKTANVNILGKVTGLIRKYSK